MKKGYAYLLDSFQGMVYILHIFLTFCNSVLKINNKVY